VYVECHVENPNFASAAGLPGLMEPSWVPNPADFIILRHFRQDGEPESEKVFKMLKTEMLTSPPTSLSLIPAGGALRAF